MFAIKRRVFYAAEALMLPATNFVVEKITGRQGKIVIGLGSGRSGTQSLARLLNLQYKAKVWHEKEQWRIPWFNGERRVKHQLHVFRFLSKFYHFVGDIAFYYLPYVPFIQEIILDVKFICMRRDRDATIKSYINWVGRLNFCPWINHDGTQWNFNHWDQCYPKYNVRTMEEAVALYYDEYYHTAEEFEKKYPRQFKIFWIDDLNTKEGQKKIFEFLNIQNPIFQVGIKTNQLLSSGNLSSK